MGRRRGCSWPNRTTGSWPLVAFVQLSGEIKKAWLTRRVDVGEWSILIGQISQVR